MCGTSPNGSIEARIVLVPSAKSLRLTERQSTFTAGGSQPTAVAGASNRPEARGNRSTAMFFGSAPQPKNARPLPAAVGAVATRLGLSVADVQLLRDSLGGTFGAIDAVRHLQNRSKSPLNAAQADRKSVV